MIKVAINGYGRIGRIAHRVILEKHKNEIDIVAINAGSSSDTKGWLNLLKYDSVYGILNGHTLEAKDKAFLIDGREIPVYCEKEATQLPWQALDVDVVIESTGKFTTQDKLQGHLTAGAKKVVLSTPAKGGNVSTFVISVNDKGYKGENLVSNASCTTNCVAPVAKIMVSNFGVEKAMMTTIHAYTSDQRLLDGGHKDPRRARSAAINIVPTSTGATVAAGEAVPELLGIFAGLSVRVPVPVGSLSDFTFVLKKDTTVEELNETFKKEAEKPENKGILEVTNEPIVSSDIVGNPHSAIIDLSLTQVVGGNLAKVVAWYDNEYAYANRLVEQVLMIGK